jgi:hypothetical protein
MKASIEKTKALLDLKKVIEANQAPRKKTTSKRTNQENVISDKASAAKKIQHLWRGYRVKQAMVKDAYQSYLSMIDPEDEQQLLSSIMFGRHQAELRENDPGRVLNPHIHDRPYYHRCDNLAGKLLTQLQEKFIPEGLSKTVPQMAVPVTLLHTVSVDAFIARLTNGKKVKVPVIKKPPHSVAFVVLDKDSIWIRQHLVSAGLVASPWEVASNASALQVDGVKKKLEGAATTLKGPDRRGLPRTIEALRQSSPFLKLKALSTHENALTHHLAASLVELLNSDIELSPDAIQRIALMIDLSNTFYMNNYPRYAFAVYAINHEISLALAAKRSPAQLEKGFIEFMDESKASLTQSLGLTDLTNLNFIASPALSGTNAFMVAKRIAATMPCEPGKKLNIKMLKPCYFELETDEFDKSNLKDADIYVFSTGPIVNMDGLTPGADINQFIRKKIIDAKRTKPVTLILDATTTLYKNLKLDPEAKALVESGQLSIIVFESHQKFGLLHTDQAQYGRVFGWCSNKNHDKKKLAQIQADARVDFDEHVDMRIGAHISVCCKHILEKIKQQHFTNGALFNQFYTQLKLVKGGVVHHEHMMKNKEELYFLTDHRTDAGKMIKQVIPGRNSFAHYATTLSYVGDIPRLCANASDDTDTLISAARLYLQDHYSSASERRAFLIHNNKNVETLSVADQIITLAAANNCITDVSQNDAMLYCALNNALKTCHALKGRQAYEEVSKAFYQLKNKVLPDHSKQTSSHAFNPDYFRAIQAMFEDEIELTDNRMERLKNNATLCTFIALKVIPFTDYQMYYFIDHSNDLNFLMKNKALLVSHKRIFKQLSKLNVVLSGELLVSLVENKNAMGVLESLSQQKFQFNAQNMMLFRSQSFIDFMAKNLPLDAEVVNALSMLKEAGLDKDESLMTLVKNNAQSRQLMKLVYETNQQVLTHLEKTGGVDKHTQSLKHTPRYLRACFLAVESYANKKTGKDGLIASINKENASYCHAILGKNRNPVSHGVKEFFNRLILAMLTIITAVTPINIRDVSHYRFFTTTSEKKLKAMEAPLKKTLEDPSTTPPSKKTKP